MIQIDIIFNLKFELDHIFGIALDKPIHWLRHTFHQLCYISNEDLRLIYIYSLLDTLYFETKLFSF